MKLKDLLKKYPWKNIRPAILALYPDQEKNINGYRLALKELFTLKPIKTKMHFIIEDGFDEDDQEQYHDVSAKDSRETSWALDFIDWRECLGMEIDPETLSKYSSLVIIVHCLWEMTYHGFTQKEISEKAGKLAKAVKEAKRDIEKKRQGKK